MRSCTIFALHAYHLVQVPLLSADFHSLFLDLPTLLSRVAQTSLTVINVDIVSHPRYMFIVDPSSFIMHDALSVT